MEADRLPFIVSRICGVCSTAHVVASVRAIERIFGTEITETARKLRELLLMGQMISNHSLVFFFLTLPDFWFSPEEDPSRRNIFQIMQEKLHIGKKAVALRSFGARIIRVLGKREVHIVSTIPGGLIGHLNKGTGEAARRGEKRLRDHERGPRPRKGTFRQKLGGLQEGRRLQDLSHGANE